MMKRRTYIIIALSCFLALPFACEAPMEQTVNLEDCVFNNPLEDLSWLNGAKRDIQLSLAPSGTQIIQYTYRGEPVFWVDMCYQCPDGLIYVYNCQGEVIYEFGGIDGTITSVDFLAEASDSTMLFLSILSDTGCQFDDPLKDLQWLKEIKQALEMSMSAIGSQIIQYTYKGEPVFWVDRCYQCPDGLIEVYNCAGQIICEFGGIDGRNTCIDFEKEASDSIVLFKNIQGR